MGGVLSKVLEGKRGQMREPGSKWGWGGVLSRVLEENGGKWGLGCVLSKVLEENGGKWGKLGANGGWGVY